MIISPHLNHSPSRGRFRRERARVRGLRFVKIWKIG